MLGKSKFFRNAGMFAMAAGVFALTSCNNDDDTDPIVPDPDPQPNYASIDVTNQIVSQNRIMVNSVNSPVDGWAVIHDDNGSNAPEVPEIISEPKFFEDGNTENFAVLLSEDEGVDNGEQIWVMLHKDDSQAMVYEFDSDQSKDVPLTDANNNTVMKAIIVTAPSINVVDQPVVVDGENKTINVSQVKAGSNGFLAVYTTNLLGEINEDEFLGASEISAGTHSNVEININSSFEYNAGMGLAVRLHIDSGDMGTFEYTPDNTSQDIPESFRTGALLEDATIWDTFTVQ